MKTRDIKKSIISKYQKHKTDTGSASVQIALLTLRINNLQNHLSKHKKDNSCRRGLLVLVGRRRKLLNYLKTHDIEEYKKITSQIKQENLQD